MYIFSIQYCRKIGKNHFFKRNSKQVLNEKEKEKSTNHFKCAGGGDRGRSVAAEEFTGSDAHYRRRSLGGFDEKRVAHGFMNQLRILQRHRIVQFQIHFVNQRRPIFPEVGLSRDGGGGAAPHRAAEDGGPRHATIGRRRYCDRQSHR